MHVEARYGLEELEAFARREKTVRVAERLRAVNLAKRGCDAPTIAKDLRRSRRAVQDWVYLNGAVCPATVAGSVGIGWMDLDLRWISEEARRSPGAIWCTWS